MSVTHYDVFTFETKLREMVSEAIELFQEGLVKDRTTTLEHKKTIYLLQTRVHTLE
jgi:hypothetical protein